MIYNILDLFLNSKRNVAYNTQRPVRYPQADEYFFWLGADAYDFEGVVEYYEHD